MVKLTPDHVWVCTTCRIVVPFDRDACPNAQGYHDAAHPVKTFIVQPDDDAATPRQALEFAAADAALLARRGIKDCNPEFAIEMARAVAACARAARACALLETDRG